MKDRKYILSVGFITVVIFAVGALLWSSGTMVLDEDTGTGTAWTLGAEDAPVVIDMYPDFNCAVCLEEERHAMQAYSAFQGKIRLVYHHYPGTAISETICIALEAAGDQGKFWEMHNRLIDDDPGDIAVMISYAVDGGQDITVYTAAYLNDTAEAVGLDMDAFAKTMNDESMLAAIRETKRKAVEDGVTTAAVFINGIEYTRGYASVDEFYSAVERELEKVETKSAE